MDTPPISPDSPWLAPMAGYSDLPFRMLCRGLGCAAACTEMLSAKGLSYGGHGTERLLASAPGDRPLVVQLFGADPAAFARAMDRLGRDGFAHFDLNAGCPVKKVLKTGGGAALLSDPERLVALARIMVRAAGAGRVGVKLRLGFSQGEDVFADLGRRLEQEGVGWLCLHPRYARQMFSGRAEWAKVRELVRAVGIPVLASGDLFTAGQAVACLEQTGAAGVMFARGALCDPAVFARFAALRSGLPAPEQTPAQLAETVRRHVELARDLDGTARGLRKIRSFIPRYAKGLDDIRALRTRLARCSSWDGLLEAAGDIARLGPAAPAPD
ncbi:MAG: tRNA-dihydrouridine synthase family protein [Desulfovibrionaceae bacterium]|nr:tRNA-dihydrouridine synthase family protein [Desulfovibrionaceae bacterium]MDD4952236.1 tRNA-dihydrouridine synthase family protein [Desulfovibrionaceae bacterium]